MAAGATHTAARTRKSSNKKAAGGFHQCWYAIARSDEVAPGQVVGRDFLEGRAIVYRGESGKPAGNEAHGADISAPT